MTAVQEPRSEPAPHPHRPLDGLHALVTGGARGIGAAIARRLAHQGARVTLTARDLAKAKAFAASLGPEAEGLALDVTDGAALDTTLAGLAERRGTVNILVNNAGVAESAPFAKLDRAHWDRMLAVNLTSVYATTHAVLPGMITHGWGRVISIASTAGLKGYGYVAAYSAAKHGVVGLTRALAVELAKTGVTVNAVCPGYADTEMAAGAIATIVAKTGKSRDQALAALTAGSPMGRLVDPDEVASAVAWLAAPDQGAVTGIALPVAGGEV